MKNKKICLVGAHGTGKSAICTRVLLTLMQNAVNKEIINPAFAINTFQELQQKINELYNIQLIPEQFRELVKDIPNFKRQTEEITLATYAKQLYLENLYTAQGKNILCDRSILDTFVYYDYFEGFSFRNSVLCSKYIGSIHKYRKTSNYYNLGIATEYTKTYSKIYLIEPSDREIEDDGFRMTDKKQQLEVHQLFLEYFKHLDNVEIVNQEDAHKEEFINKVVSKFII